MHKSTNGPDQIQQELLYPIEVTSLYPLSTATLAAWRHSGAGPKSFKVCGRRVYPRASLDEWCKRIGIPPCTPPTPADGPVQCAPRCERGDGHGEQAFREDQACHSETLRLDLSRELPVEDAVPIDNGFGWAPGPDYLEVYLQRAAGADVVVCVSRHEDAPVRFTAGEAGQLVEALQLLLGQAGSAR